jgi:RNA polymerase sigma-70 factor (ECF subfamily)
LIKDRDLSALALALHHRLIAGDDVVVTSEIAEALLLPLIERLRRRFYWHSDQHLIDEQAGQSLLNYFLRPASFDPAKGTLLGFLKMDASRNIMDIIRAERRKKDVEVPLAYAEYLVGGQFDGPDWEIIRRELSPVLQQLDARLTDPLDRRLLALMIEGERGTRAFAAELGIQHLEQHEQERVVKRHKDRLKKRLQRELKRRERI